MKAEVTKNMSTMLQFLVPLLTALLVLGVFHLVAYLHLQLAEAEVELDEPDSASELTSL